MRHLFRIAVPLAASLAALGALPASAQYANEFTPAKLLKQGTTSRDIAGNGTVVVQVQVNPDGTHKAIKVIRSTNAGDNDAAMDIAQNSSYHPAHRGTTPIASFYDFTLKFNGKSVASSQEGGGSAGGAISPAAQQVAALIRARQYEQAKSKAESELLSSPGDDSLREMLGIAAYDSDDFTAAAAAFDKVPTIGKQFQPIAAQSFATAAVKVSQDNPTQAMGYAQKAIALDPSSAIARFGLGSAQLANGQNADALATLKAAQSAAAADPKVPTAFKIRIDSALLQAYLANNDQQGAQQVAAQIKQLDPASTAGARAMGATLIKSGQAAAAAKDTPTALKDYDQAAALGDPEVSVTANVLAAFAIAQGTKPDYKQMQVYAEKALALKADDPEANFAEGIALTGQWASGHDEGTKKKAADALAKADQEAKAAGNESLALQIETFVKQNLNAAGSGPPAGS